jgi:hypothetical protein
MDHSTGLLPSAWHSCKYDPPYVGKYVEISRDQVHTDFVWWYPEQGNWSVEGMFWLRVVNPDE